MLQNFIENPFQNTKVGYPSFGQFVKSHLALLAAANDKGLHAQMIALLQPKYNVLKEWLDKQDKILTDRKGKTLSVDAIIINFKTFIKKEVFKEVSYKFEDTNKEVFNKFFPSGLTEYTKITKKTAEVLFDRIDEACKAHKTELPAGLDAKAANFNTSYLNARNNQLSGKGSVKDTSIEGEALRADIANTMYINLLNQLIINANKPEVVLSLYETEFITPKKKKKSNSVKV